MQSPQTEHVRRQPTFAESQHTCLGQEVELPFTSQAVGTRENTLQAGLGPLLRREEPSHHPLLKVSHRRGWAGGLSPASVPSKTFLDRKD